MGLIEPLKRISDIGVREGMPVEEARYIRILNIGAMVYLIFRIYNIFPAILTEHYPYAITKAITIILLLLVFLFNKTGHYTMARLWMFVNFFSFQLVNTAIDDPGIIGHYNFIIYLFFAFILFPKNEQFYLFAIIFLALICFASSIYIHDFVNPLYPLTKEQLIKTNTNVMIKSSFLILAFGLLERYLRHLSEEEVKKEKDKVIRLSKRLQVYLPYQFVETLATTSAENDEYSYRRRRLTIFFSDVQGFTKWTDRLEPEEVREILNHYLSEMSAIAHKWGGTIDKFIGDALMIFFGDPEFTNDQDHALRCVIMAMEMQAKMAELRTGWRKMAYDEPLHIRIGINTGWATVGNFGSEDRLNYTALGSAVNLASRLEAACAPDKITVSHTTFLLIEDEIACEPKGQIEVKGFSEPVKIYEVVGLKPKADSR